VCERGGSAWSGSRGRKEIERRGKAWWWAFVWTVLSREGKKKKTGLSSRESRGVGVWRFYRMNATSSWEEGGWSQVAVCEGLVSIAIVSVLLGTRGVGPRGTKN